MTLGVTMACEPVICNATPDEAAGARVRGTGRGSCKRISRIA